MSKIFILTGAGISAESGIRTFRGTGGLWEGYHLQEVACPEAFRSDPSLVYRFYNMRRAEVMEATPNPAHLALAKLQERLPDQVVLVTQNVDDLHERAGSKDVIHMHGEAMKARCQQCAVTSPCGISLDETNACTSCGSVGTLRPHVVWFGEVPLFMEQIEGHLAETSLFVAIGTSGVVYPAAGFARLAALHGAKTVEINPEETGISFHFDEHLRGPAAEQVPLWVETLLSGD